MNGDITLKFDPSYREISLRFKNDPEEYALAFTKAWFKPTHRDMGPRARYPGSEVPGEALIWQGPVLTADYKQINAREVKKLKGKISASDLTNAELVRTAWASAGSFRVTDMRGGANGTRVRLALQKGWAANNPRELVKVLKQLGAIQQDFNESLSRGKQVSLADVIVLGGAVAVERGSDEAGRKVDVPFRPGRVDATQTQTDASSFAVLEPAADGFRNYYGEGNYRSPAEMLVDRANLLTLTVPEMAVLVGG